MNLLCILSFNLMPFRLELRNMLIKNPQIYNKQIKIHSIDKQKFSPLTMSKTKSSEAGRL